jgi:hypothetical protein
MIRCLGWQRRATQPYSATRTDRGAVPLGNGRTSACLEHSTRVVVAISDRDDGDAARRT